MKYLVLFNPLAHSNTGKKKAETLKEKLTDGSVEFADLTSEPYTEYISALGSDDKIIVCGGDGTLNRFINKIDGMKIPNKILYYPTGSGNDFYKDVCDDDTGETLIPLNKFITDLPLVTVKGKTCRFLNGIGYGIDGYCCEIGDIQRQKSDKPVNYAGIAIKGLLFKYKPTNAVITVDGKKYEFRNVWLAPTMNGRYYGGGMIPTPKQNRLGDGTLSVMVYHTRSKLQALSVFPSIFKGEHVKKSKVVEVITGKDITVQFDRPVALQIDGETVLNVSECNMRAVK